MQPELQAAVYARLNGYLTAPVFDFVPPGTKTPYVTVGEDNFTPDDTDDSLGGEAFVEIEIWSTYEGKKEAKALAKAIYQRMHRAELEVDGYSLAVAHWDSSDSFEEPDGKTTRAVEIYRVVIHE